MGIDWEGMSEEYDAVTYNIDKRLEQERKLYDMGRYLESDCDEDEFEDTEDTTDDEECELTEEKLKELQEMQAEYEAELKAEVEAQQAKFWRGEVDFFECGFNDNSRAVYLKQDSEFYMKKVREKFTQGLARRMKKFTVYGFTECDSDAREFMKAVLRTPEACEAVIKYAEEWLDYDAVKRFLGGNSVKPTRMLGEEDTAPVINKFEDIDPYVEPAKKIKTFWDSK